MFKTTVTVTSQQQIPHKQRKINRITTMMFCVPYPFLPDCFCFIVLHTMYNSRLAVLYLSDSK